MKKVIALLAAFLIIIGWFLEVYYYYYRLDGDGVIKSVAIIIGVGLTLFLSLLFIKVNIKKILISIPVIIFSIFCTTSGQSFSLSVKDQLESSTKAQEENLAEKKQNYIQSITELKIDLEKEQTVIDVSLDERMYANKNGIQPTNESIDKIKADIKYYESLRDSVIDTMITSETVQVKPMNTYILISEEFPVLSPRWLKLYAQITLSFLIALMAPAGILVMSGLKKSEPISIPEIIPEIKPEPEIIPEPEPEPEKIELSNTAISNIILMLTGEKKLLTPLQASEKFETLPDTIEKNLHYTPEECGIVYDFIIEKKLENENRDRILEVWNESII